MPDYVDIGKYSIKTDDFLAYHYECSAGETKKCTKNKTCCCGFYFVDTTARKVRRIFDIFDVITQFATGLKIDNKYINPFEENENHRYSIDTKDDDYCVFSYLDKDDALRCAIHSAALKLNADPFFYKPLPCAIWPVTVFKERLGKTIVCLDTATKSSCLKKKCKADGLIDPALMKNLELLTGANCTRLHSVLLSKVAMAMRD